MSCRFDGGNFYNGLSCVGLQVVTRSGLGKILERKLQDEINTALAQANSSAVEPESASVGLAALALGAVGLRRRRKAATA